eukprot:1159454-Pelagomonas_calceolata.AAC.4
MGAGRRSCISCGKLSTLLSEQQGSVHQATGAKGEPAESEVQPKWLDPVAPKVSNCDVQRISLNPDTSWFIFRALVANALVSSAPLELEAWDV